MSAEGAFRDGNASGFQLIETLRWEPGIGFVRLERHLSRLYASARLLDFACDPQRVGESLATVEAQTPQRVRLAVSSDGDVAVATQAFQPVSVDTVWKLKIATARLDSTNPLITHKTTRRQTYEAARSEFPVWEADEILLLNENGLICEGTITNLFVASSDGHFITPALSCGLLPGVLRQELIDSGKAVEAEMTVDDLTRTQATFVGNSLRGLITAKLVAPDER